MWSICSIKLYGAWSIAIWGHTTALEGTEVSAGTEIGFSLWTTLFLGQNKLVLILCRKAFYQENFTEMPKQVTFNSILVPFSQNFYSDIACWNKLLLLNLLCQSSSTSVIFSKQLNSSLWCVPESRTTWKRGARVVSTFSLSGVVNDNVFIDSV